MPSFLHQALVQLFKNRPTLAPELLRDALSLDFPGYSEVRLESPDLTQLAPTELHADLVLLLVDERPVLGIVVEVQLNRDDRKSFRWPLYVTALRARYKCETCVFVVAPSAEVARRAAEPIQVGPGLRMHPFVLGPADVPIVVALEEARAAPELAVLSAVVHGSADLETAVQVALTAVTAVRELDPERRLLYAQMIRSALSEAARKALEMSPESVQFFDEEFKQFFDKGRAEGEAQGEARGEARGRAQAVLNVLQARGLAVSDEQRERILATVDLELLDRWIRRAVAVAATEALFG